VNLDRGGVINDVFNAKTQRTQRKYQFKKQSEKVAPFTGKQEQSESLMNCFFYTKNPLRSLRLCVESVCGHVSP
jgi:hypothetical protein